MRPRTRLTGFRVQTGADRRDAKTTDMDLAMAGLPARVTVARSAAPCRPVRFLAHTALRSIGIGHMG